MREIEVEMVKNIENKMQSMAMEAYQKTARRSATVVVSGEENTFKREYAQELVKDYFYKEQQMESPREKRNHLQKLKASIDSLELPSDVKIAYHSEELSLDGFVKLLESEMASFEENKAEKKEEVLKKEQEEIKNLKEEEIENIVHHTKGMVTIGDVAKFRGSVLKVTDRKKLPPEVIAQIKKHYENQGIAYTPEHEKISIQILEKGVELSPEICCNLDSLLRVKNAEISRLRIEELAKDFREIREIKVEDFILKAPYQRKEVEKIVRDLQELDDNYLQKIGTSFRTIEEALNHYHAYEETPNAETPNAGELSTLNQNQIRFQYVRYQMTLEKALTLNSRGIQIDKTELITIERELMRLEVSEDRLTGVAQKMGISQEAMLDKLLAVEHNKSMVLASDYGVVNKITLDMGLEKIADVSQQNPATKIAERYDALGTQVRKDLGDSINKAFYRLNSLLLANKIEVSTENLRAAAILGRGEVPITAVNIEQIKEIDQKLQSVLKGLTPEMVLEKMADGEDILSYGLEHLAEMVEEVEGKAFRRMSERVAQRISSLEKQNLISGEQRENLILFYRMLNTIEQSQSAAAAVLMKDNRSLTLENMYDVAKYLKNPAGIDETVSPETGLADGKEWEDLKTQIRSGLLQKKNEMRQFLREVEQDVLSKTDTLSAKYHLDALKNYTQKDWEALFAAWKSPTLADAQIYKEFQKIPFLLSDSLRRLEKVTEKQEKAKIKLEELKTTLQSEDFSPRSGERAEQVYQLLKEMESDWAEVNEEAHQQMFRVAMEVKRQWQIKTRLSKEQDFTQIPVWSGKNLHQVNVYFPKEKREEVSRTGQVSVLLSFEMRKGKVAGLLEAGKEKNRLLLDIDRQELKQVVREKKDEIVKVFSENGFTLDSLELGSFREQPPFEDASLDRKEKIEEELINQEDREYLLNSNTKIPAFSQEKIFALAKNMAELLLQWDS